MKLILLGISTAIFIAIAAGIVLNNVGTTSSELYASENTRL